MDEYATNGTVTLIIGVTEFGTNLDSNIRSCVHRNSVLTTQYSVLVVLNDLNDRVTRIAIVLSIAVLYIHRPVHGEAC